MRHHSPQLHSAQQPYLPGVDGLRALAVGAVLLYHAELAAVPGGFLGVEVFFVISGYLITALLLAGWQQHGRVRLGAFWLRRARRLLPALAALLLAVLAWAVLALPAEVASLRYDALAAAGYSTNWYLIAQQRSYFEAVGRPSLLLHLWSLAVEEQFYLIWPLLFAAGIRLGRRRLLVLVLLGAAASATSMALRFQPDIDPSRLYYGTDTRASGLLLGAALALIATPALGHAAEHTLRIQLFGRAFPLIAWGQGRGRTRTSADRRPSLGARLRSCAPQAWALERILIELAGLGALALLGYWFTTVNEFQSFMYQGGLLAVGLATATLIAAVAHPRAWLLPRLLGAAPLRWLGLRSYSLYLWHWPVFMLTRPQLDTALDGWALLILRLALATLLAEISYRWVEQPFRTGAAGSAWRCLWAAQGAQRWWLRLRWLASLLICVGLGGLLGHAVVIAQPPAPPAYLAGAEPAPAAPSGPLVRQIVAAAPTPAPPTPLPDLASGFALEAPTVLSQARAAYAPPRATPTPAPAPELHVIAIGDSVMAGAAKALGESIAGIDIDTLRGRQAAAVIELLAERRAAGQLGDLVIIHTGNNGPFSARQFDAIMEQLADVHQVVFVNVRVPRRWERPNNAMIAESAQRYPHVLLIDWYAASVGRPELFWRDGIHLRPAGARYYAELIAAATRAALATR